MVVKFCTVVGYIKCYPWDDRLSLKKAWPGSREPFLKFYTPLNFSGMAEDRIVKFCARLDASTVSLVMMINCPRVGVVKVT